MVFRSSTARGRIFKLVSRAPEIGPTALQLVTARWSESMSQPYRIEMEFASKDRRLDGNVLMAHAAFLAIKQGVSIRGSERRGVQTLRMHGVLASFEQGEKHEEWVRYRAVLVPRLWRLSLNVRSQIFLEKTTPEIVETILREAGFGDEDFEFRQSGRYPRREFVVQHQESDLAFLSRWLEHEGIFYFFHQSDEREKVVFGDAISAPERALGDMPLRYQPQSEPGRAWTEPEVIRNFTCRQHLIPKEVVLQDYNHRTPSVILKTSAPVAASGPSYGSVYEYGDHYKDSTEGEALAKVRAEEIRCRERIFTGTSDGKSLRAGSVFTLAEHYQHDFNRDYLVTDSRHAAEQAMVFDRSVGPVSKYECEVTCIPANVPYRPARVTPKPRISGTMNARVDAAGDGKYAEIDAQGRYKVQLPLDLSGKGNGAASRYVRKAEPYSGAGMGMHFPLHKGTEVVLGFTNGDVDRPFILGSIPNAETVGPVTGNNQTQCVIQTGGGSKMVIEDTDDRQQIAFSCPKENTTFHMGHGCIGMSTDGNHEESCGGNRKWLTVGWDSDVTLGAYVSATFGAEVVMGYALRVEKAGGPHLFENPILSIDSQVMVKIHAGKAIHMGAPRAWIHGLAELQLKSGESAVQMTPAEIAITAPKFGAAAKGEMLLHGNPITIYSKGKLNAIGTDVIVTGSGTVDVKASGNLNLKGSGSVNVDGPLCDIKTDAKIAKTLKVGGSTFTVD